MSIIKFLIPVAILISASWLMLSKRVEQLYPLPYKSSERLTSDILKKEVENSNVLIIGSHLADKSLLNKDTFKDALSVLSDKGFDVSYLARKTDGLHRSLLKLEELEKYPKTIVLMTGTSEFTEMRFDKDQAKLIMADIKTFKNEDIFSLILLFPSLSKVIYNPVKRKPIDLQEIPWEFDIYDPNYARYLEITYALFEIELEKLAKIVYDNDLKLIVVIPPINLTQTPNLTCAHAYSATLDVQLKDAKRLLDKGRSKEVIITLSKFTEVIAGNAHLYYYLGMAYLQQNQLNNARRFLTLAHSYDCLPSAGSPVINSILKKFVTQYQFDFVNMEEVYNNELGKNDVFMDKTELNSIYLNLLFQETIAKIKKIYRLIK